MSDTISLIEQLRRQYDSSVPGREGYVTESDAADALASLQAENESLKHDLTGESLRRESLAEQLYSTQSDVSDLIAERDRLREELEAAQDALRKLKDWARAYPVEIFPEPNFAAVRVALEQHALSLDQVSASNMRHVITQAEKIIDAALAKEKRDE